MVGGARGSPHGACDQEVEILFIQLRTPAPGILLASFRMSLFISINPL